MEHHFDIDVAKEYGIAEAVLINHFQFWIAKNKANGTNFHDGRYWTFNSQKAMLELFPYLSQKSIRTVLQHLTDRGVIIVGNYNDNLYNRTNWYAFADEDKWLCSKGQIHMPETANGEADNGKCKTDNIPYNNADSNTPIIPQGGESVTVEEVSDDELVFDTFRKAYKGTKRGLQTEFINFKKKHKDWREVLVILLPSYQAQQTKREQALRQGCFVPQEKNLSTYINQRCWEAEEHFEPDSRSQQRAQQVVPGFVTPEGQARQKRVDEFVEALANS